LVSIRDIIAKIIRSSLSIDIGTTIEKISSLAKELLICYLVTTSEEIAVQAIMSIIDANVGNSHIRRRSPEPLPTVHIHLNNNREIVVAIINSGTTINIISWEKVYVIGLLIKLVNAFIYGTDNSKTRLYSVCNEVLVEVGRIKNYIDIYVLKDTQNELILGIPYFLQAFVKFSYNDRSLFISLTDQDEVTRGTI
jgi:hypothetical protein